MAKGSMKALAAAARKTERMVELNGRNFHFKRWDASEDALAVLHLAEIGTFGYAVGSDEVVALIVKLGAGSQAGAFADDPIALDNELGTVGVGDDPLASPDGDDTRAVIVNGDVVNKSVRPVGGPFLVRIVFDAVEADP